jgi:hypothetical protein
MRCCRTARKPHLHLFDAAIPKGFFLCVCPLPGRGIKENVRRFGKAILSAGDFSLRKLLSKKKANFLSHYFLF